MRNNSPIYVLRYLYGGPMFTAISVERAFLGREVDKINPNPTQEDMYRECPHIGVGCYDTCRYLSSWHRLMSAAITMPTSQATQASLPGI